MSISPRLIALLVAAIMLGVLMAPAQVLGSPPRDAPAPVSLLGDGTWGANKTMGGWGNALFNSPTPVNLAYLSQGSLLGRQGVLDGQLDFFVSGPTPALQADLAGARTGFLAIPLQSDALGFLLKPPPGGFSTTPTAVPYSGPLQFPLRNLALSYFDRNLDGSLYIGPSNPLNGLGGLVGGAEVTVDSNVADQPYDAADLTPGDSTYYLEQYLTTVVPTAWNGALAAKNYPVGAVSERWPDVIQFGNAFTGAIKALNALGANAGGLAALPPWAQGQAHLNFPGPAWQFVQVRNAAGEWVGPTPDAVQAALVAGGGQALSALTSPEPGGYPLSWVDSLYAPTSGLSVEKTNALATFVRYAVTGGSSVAMATGSIPLPPSLVPQALNGADELVRDNCTGPGLVVVSTTDPGSYAPPHALDAVGPMLRCQPLAGSGSGSGSGGSVPGPGGSAAHGASPPPTAASQPPGTPASKGNVDTGSGAPAPGTAAGVSGWLSGGLASLGGLRAQPEVTDTAPALAPVAAPATDAAAGPRAARLIYGLPFSQSSRNNTQLVVVVAALACWRGYVRLARRRRRPEPRP